MKSIAYRNFVAQDSKFELNVVDRKLILFDNNSNNVVNHKQLMKIGVQIT